jgi:hypothetical protein
VSPVQYLFQSWAHLPVTCVQVLFHQNEQHYAPMKQVLIHFWQLFYPSMNAAGRPPRTAVQPSPRDVRVLIDATGGQGSDRSRPDVAVCSRDIDVRCRGSAVLLADPRHR